MTDLIPEVPLFPIVGTQSAFQQAHRKVRRYLATVKPGEKLLLWQVCQEANVLDKSLVGKVLQNLVATGYMTRERIRDDFGKERAVYQRSGGKTVKSPTKEALKWATTSSEPITCALFAQQTSTSSIYASKALTRVAKKLGLQMRYEFFYGEKRRVYYPLSGDTK